MIFLFASVIYVDSRAYLYMNMNMNKGIHPPADRQCFINIVKSNRFPQKSYLVPPLLGRITYKTVDSYHTYTEVWFAFLTKREMLAGIFD